MSPLTQPVNLDTTFNLLPNVSYLQDLLLKFLSFSSPPSSLVSPVPSLLPSASQSPVNQLTSTALTNNKNTLNNAAMPGMLPVYWISRSRSQCLHLFCKPVFLDYQLYVMGTLTVYGGFFTPAPIPWFKCVRGGYSFRGRKDKVQRAKNSSSIQKPLQKSS